MFKVKVNIFNFWWGLGGGLHPPKNLNNFAQADFPPSRLPRRAFRELRSPRNPAHNTTSEGRRACLRPLWPQIASKSHHSAPDRLRIRFCIILGPGANLSKTHQFSHPRIPKSRPPSNATGRTWVWPLQKSLRNLHKNQLWAIWSKYFFLVECRPCGMERAQNSGRIYVASRKKIHGIFFYRNFE